MFPAAPLYSTKLMDFSNRIQQQSLALVDVVKLTNSSEVCEASLCRIVEWCACRQGDSAVSTPSAPAIE